jgi:hypothetical protein
MLGRPLPPRLSGDWFLMLSVRTQAPALFMSSMLTLWRRGDHFQLPFMVLEMLYERLCKSCSESLISTKPFVMWQCLSTHFILEWSYWNHLEEGFDITAEKEKPQNPDMEAPKDVKRNYHLRWHEKAWQVTMASKSRGPTDRCLELLQYPLVLKLKDKKTS